MASDKVVPVNDGNFASEVLESDLPVLIDFTAGWCQPCHVVAPLIDQIADEYDGRVKVTKLDVDESPTTARKYGIRGIPTLVVVKDGEVVGQVVGAVPKGKIAELVNRAL